MTEIQFPILTTVEEARIVIPTEGSEKNCFVRGFRQPADRIYPALPSGTLLEAAQAFAEDDTASFSDVEGMQKIFESDEYALGVVMAIYSVRKLRKVITEENDDV